MLFLTWMVRKAGEIGYSGYVMFLDANTQHQCLHKAVGGGKGKREGGLMWLKCVLQSIPSGTFPQLSLVVTQSVLGYSGRKGCRDISQAALPSQLCFLSLDSYS